MNLTADVNTVVLDVERVVSDCEGLRLVVGRLRRGTDHEDLPTCAVFSRDTVSRYPVGPGSAVAVHPPW